MPEIRIQYRDGALTENGVFRIRELLRTECISRFSVPEHPLTHNSFSIYVEPVSAPSVQTHDVIVRIPLHNFPDRVRTGDKHAAELADLIQGKLDRPQYVGHRIESLTVGVSLLLAEIAWGEAVARKPQFG